MLELLKRHIVILVGLAMGWSGYSFYSDGGGKPEALAKSDALDIDPQFLAIRDVNVPFTVANDPYRLDGLVAVAPKLAPGEGPGGMSGSTDAISSPSSSASTGASAGGPTPAVAASAGPLSRAELEQALAGALRQVASDAMGFFTDGETAGAASGAATATRPPANFTLLLQSTLEMSTGGQARINNRTVGEGETMPFLDPLDPPVLRRVAGTTVIVSHAGRDYALDLLTNPLLQVGEAALAPTPQAGGGSAPKASKPQKAAAPAGAAPAKAPASKGKGGYRVRGKNKS